MFGDLSIGQNLQTSFILRCIACREIESRPTAVRCAACDGTLEVVYDEAVVRATPLPDQMQQGVWRYRALLPRQTEAAMPDRVLNKEYVPNDLPGDQIIAHSVPSATPPEAYRVVVRDEG